MLTLETLNELTLKVTCTGNDVLYTKAGAFIAGDSPNGKNYRFEKVLLGPQSGLMQAAFGSLVRRVTGENFSAYESNDERGFRYLLCELRTACDRIQARL